MGKTPADHGERGGSDEPLDTSGDTPSVRIHLPYILHSSSHEYRAPFMKFDPDVHKRIGDSSSHDHQPSPADLNAPNFERIDELYYKFGPTPRIALQFLSTPKLLKEHEEAVITTARELTPDMLHDAI